MQGLTVEQVSNMQLIKEGYEVEEVNQGEAWFTIKDNKGETPVLWWGYQSIIALEQHIKQKACE